MKVLIAGAGGMLGHDVVLAAGNAGHEVVGFGHQELDVTDADGGQRRIGAERPDVVINCAAWTDVDGAEDAEAKAMAVNGTGAGDRRRGSRIGGRQDRLRLQRLRLRRREGFPLRRDRPARPALRLRTHQAGRRRGDRGGQPAELRRPLLLAVRGQRTELRRDHAAPGRRSR